MKKHPKSYSVRRNTRKYSEEIGKTPDVLEKISIKCLSSNPNIKYMAHTPLHIPGEKVTDFLVYSFLTKHIGKIMYAKYALNIKTGVVVFMAWHPSKKPNDTRFKDLK